MTSFWKKLDTAVRAQINDLIDFNKDDETSRARRKYLARHDVNRSLQGDVKALKSRIDDALKYEEQLQAKVDELYASIAEWDQKADAAVSEGRDDDARLALGRMQQAQRELEMEESALNEHRYLTRELMSQVNALESTLFEANQDAPTEAAEVDDGQESESVVENIARQIDQTRRTLSQLVEESIKTVTGAGEPSASQREDEGTPSTRPAHPVNRREVDNDLEQRRSRLARPPEEPKSDE